MVERRVLEMMLRARHAKKIQIVNGLKPGEQVVGQGSLFLQFANSFQS